MSESNEGSGRFTVTLPRAVIEQLETLAEERGTKRAVLLREAAYLYLKAQGQQPQRRAS